MKNGLPQVDATNCLADVGKFSLDATSNNKATEFLYKIFTNFVSVVAKNLINSQVCKEAVAAINKNGNNMLKTMAVNVPIVREIASVDYKLSDQPVGTANGLEFSLKGDVNDPKASTRSALTPQPMAGISRASSPDTGPMFMIQFSDSLFNSLTKQLHEQNLFKVEITENLVPVALRPLFKMKCNLLRGQFCAGLFLQQIQKKSGFLELHVSSSVAPSINTQASKINGKAGLNVGFFVRDGYNLHPVINSKVSIDMGIKAMVKGTRLIWELTNITPKVELGQGQVQQLVKQGVDLVLGSLTQNMMLPIVNQVFKQGFQLPTLDGIHFWKPTVELNNGHLLLGVDFAYDPNRNADSVEELPLIVQGMLDKARANRK